jgi:hypothetical protein
VTETATYNASSIHYDWSEQNNDTIVEYYKRVSHDLEVRGLAVDEDEELTPMQARLARAMIEERKFRELAEQIEYGKGNGKIVALYDVMQNPPCILHLHMRISLKMITTIFNMGLKNVLEGKMNARLFDAGVTTTSVKSQFEAFMKKVEVIMNTTVLSNEMFPTNWYLPHDPKTRTLLPLSMGDKKCRRVFDNIQPIIDCCLLPTQKPDQYAKVFLLLKETMKLMNKKTDFSNDE